MSSPDVNTQGRGMHETPSMHAPPLYVVGESRALYLSPAQTGSVGVSIAFLNGFVMANHLSDHKVQELFGKVRVKS